MTKLTPLLKTGFNIVCLAFIFIVLKADTKSDSPSGSILHNTAPVELFGRVSLVEAYEVPGFSGFHALVTLRDGGKTVAVISKSDKLQALCTAALTSGKLIAFRGELNNNPPKPLGGTWSTPVYDITVVILYQ